MSVSKGNNSATGTTNNNSDDEKALKAAAAAATKQAKVIDGKFNSALKGMESGLEKVAATLLATRDEKVTLNGKDVNIWRLCVDAEGNPFTSWNKYVVARLSQYPIAATVFRGPVVKMLVNAGLSMREAAAALHVSAATVSNDVNGRADGQGRNPRTAGDGVDQSPAKVAAKVATQSINVNKKVVDSEDEMSDEDIAKLIADYRQTYNVLVGIAKLRKQGSGSAAA